MGPDEIQPGDAADVPEDYQGDPTKPNHLTWDGLGNPYQCDSDHNHP